MPITIIKTWLGMEQISMVQYCTFVLGLPTLKQGMYYRAFPPLEQGLGQLFLRFAQSFTQLCNFVFL